MFKYGDSVQVKSTGAVGVVCDIRYGDGEKCYIIDQHPYLNTDDADEWLVEAPETDLEHK